MWCKKSTHTERVHAEPVWDVHMLAVLDRIETRLDRLEALVRLPYAPQPTPVSPPVSAIASWMPLVDRLQEIALVALGSQDLAQQFGLTSRQKENAEAAGPTTWTEPDEPTREGVTYG